MWVSACVHLKKIWRVEHRKRGRHIETGLVDKSQKSLITFIILCYDTKLQHSALGSKQDGPALFPVLT